MTRTGRSLLWVAGFVALALLGLTLLALAIFRVFDSEVVTPPEPTTGSAPDTVSRSAAASALLATLETALVDGTRRDVLALAAAGEPAARRNLRWIHDNVRDLGITDLSLRFVDESPGQLADQHRRTFGKDAWVADVDLEWRLRGYERSGSSMEVALTLVGHGEDVAFASSTGNTDAAAPLWLLEDLAAERSRLALVAVADEAQVDNFARRAVHAVRDVRAVLPRWRGSLVVEVPASQEQLNRILAAEPGTYDSIAAVTATVDGSSSARSPAHVFVNPDVFGRLGEDGAQIVLSHEATHVALDAATSDMPLWLLEGFADYVALARTDLPVAVTASQILAEVGRNGPPRSLPGADEFDPSHKHLGTSYEAAWLACRLLAEEYGERRLVAFYRSVDRGASTDEAFAELGTTEQEFTRMWRRYLRELAG